MGVNVIPATAARALVAFLLVLAAAIPGACERKTANAPAPGAAKSPAAAPQGALELVFPYGSEKKLWLEQVTEAFNTSMTPSTSGKPVHVSLKAMGSGELIEETLAGRLQAHIVSPASGAFIQLGNARSQASTGSALVGATQDLVLSPVVIAMWKPMAEALGWPGTQIGWSDVLAMAKNPEGWAARGAPQWGRFKFGHTHPEYSNSGLISIVAQAYASAGKVSDLTLEDLNSPTVRSSMNEIQSSIVHYGDSTGFFGRKLFSNGPEYLSAAVLYENMVIESYEPGKYNLPFPVVAIYPREGTFWSEHPVGIVERPWVTDEHRAAARTYIEFLLARPQQEAAMALGFRPADVSLPLGAPIDAAHGVDPREPQTTLRTPGADVINATVELWKKEKKKSSVVLILDTSGSMKEEKRIVHAKEGAVEFLRMLGDEDYISLLPFSSKPHWAIRDARVADERAKAIATVESLFPEGGTALYDSILDGFRHVHENAANRSRITAVVVLTDGADTDSATELDALVEAIRSDAETRDIRVFTIGYGERANKEVLQRIAESTQAKFFVGTAENVRQVFKEIATYF